MKLCEYKAHFPNLIRDITHIGPSLEYTRPLAKGEKSSLIRLNSVRLVYYLKPAGPYTHELLLVFLNLHILTFLVTFTQRSTGKIGISNGTLRDWSIRRHVLR